MAKRKLSEILREQEEQTRQDRQQEIAEAIKNTKWIESEKINSTINLTKTYRDRYGKDSEQYNNMQTQADLANWGKANPTIWDKVKSVASENLNNAKKITGNIGLGAFSGIKQIGNYSEYASEQNISGYKAKRNAQYLASPNVSDLEKAQYKTQNSPVYRKLKNYGLGNIDLNHREKVKNDDGSISTVRSISFRDEEGKEVLIPTVIDGKVVSDEQAIEHYYKTGEYLGKFNSIEEANKYAETLHNQQQLLYGNEIETNLIKKNINDSINKDSLKIQENIENVTGPISRKLAELAPSIGQMGVGSVASSINPALGITYFTTSAGGSYIDEAKQRGMTDKQAYQFGTIMGAMEGITEEVGIENFKKAGIGIKSLVTGTKVAGKEVAENSIKAVLKDYGIGIADNFMQEAIIEPIQEAVATGVAGKDKADWNNIGGRMLKSGIDGALTAMITGGAELGVQSCVGVIEKINNGQQPTQQEISQSIQDAQKNGVNIEEAIQQGVQQAINNQSQDIINQNQLTAPINNESQEQSSLQDLNNINEQKYVYEKSENKKIDDFRKSVAENTNWNDSEQTHNFTNMLEKIIDDKNIDIRFDSNLTDSNGNIANGSYNNGVITINPNSNRAGEFIAIHELTHAIGTKDMIDMVQNYRNNNTEFNSAVEKLLKNYNATEINEEALADISGQLFGNQEFINNIAQNNPNIFQKIYNEIKYLWHQFRGYKNQNQFVEDLYYKWTQAYNSNNQLNNNESFLKAKLDNGESTVVSEDINGTNPTDREAKRSLENMLGIKYINEGNSKEISIENKDIGKFLHDGYNNYKSARLKKRIAGNYGEVIEIAKEDMQASKPNYKGSNRGKQGFDYYDVNLTYPIRDAKGNTVDYKNYEARLVVRKDNGGNFAYDLDNFKIKNGATLDKSSLSIMSDKSDSGSSTNSIPPTQRNVNDNTKYSIQESENNSGSFSMDNKGRKLSQKQQEYFKDSKVKDKDGNLKTVYHTTTDKTAQFNEFNPIGTPYYRFGDQVVNYFTDSKDMSGSYANNQYKMADTSRLENMQEVKKYLDKVNSVFSDGNGYSIKENNGTYYLTSDNELDVKALAFLKDLSDSELQQLKDNIFIDEDFAGTPYYKAFSWDKFTKDLQEKYHNLTNQYVGNEALIDLQKRMIEYIENPKKMASDEKHLIKTYKTKEDLYRNVRKEIEKDNWVSNEKIQYEGYVNITNPYIIDAEGKNWDSVVSKLSKDIEKNIREIKSDTKKVTDLINLQLESEQKYKQYNQTNAHEGYLTQAQLVKDLQRGLPLELRYTIDDAYLFGFDYIDYAKETNANAVDGNKLVKDLLIKYAEEHDSNDIRNFNTKIEKYGNLTLNDFLKQANKAMEQEKKYGKKDAYFRSEVEKILNRDITKYFDDDFITGEQLYKLAEGNFSQNAILDVLGERQTTNDIVKQVIEMNKNGANYDGVIMKNVIDYGGQSRTREKANLYVTFDSNQFKAKDNSNPTSDKDIRYSKKNQTWQEYLESKFKSTGTRTDLSEIKLPTKEQRTPPIKQEQKRTPPLREEVKPTKGEVVDYSQMEKPQGKIRKHYRSIIESGETTAEAKKIAKEMMGLDTYTPQSNETLLQRADSRINNSTPEAELKSLLSKAMNSEKISDVDIAVGERLIEYFSKTGSKENLQDAIHATAMAGTQAGRATQALALLNHATPQGQVTWLQRSIAKANNELQQKYKNKKEIPQFELTSEMTEKILNTNTKEEMFKALDEVYEELGEQVPKTTIEKIDEWRYFSMLANIKTHGRNMIGNFAMNKIQKAKNKVAGAIEGTVAKFNPDMERTHTLKKANKETKNFAKKDVLNMDVQTELGMNENKYNPQSRLQNARKTFKNDTLNNTIGKAFDINSNLLEVEDNIGLKSMYVSALSDYITANNIDVNKITDAELGKARKHAIKEAKEATFHQESALATALNQMGTKNAITKFALDSAVPFKKTPINVAKTGVQYSPAGLIKSAVLDSVKLRKGDISVNQYIDNISKGLTGTGITFMGYVLAQAGLLKASGSDDDKKEQYEEEQGKQSYSIEINGKTYSLDWLAPAGIPLFIGAEINQQFKQSKEEKGNKSNDDDKLLNQAIKKVENIANATANAMNPMSEMSMISGLTSILSSYNKENAVGDMIVNTGKSYINQYIPTALSQIARTTDEYERTTKSTKTGTLAKAVEQTINQVKSKIPGIRQTLPIRTDIWGKDLKQPTNLPLRAFNNFINPSTAKEVSTDKVDKELNSLYSKTGESSILPKSIDKTFTINGQTYRMTNEEYSKYTKSYGENAHKLIDSFIGSSEYKNLSEEQKIKAISKVYEFVKENNKIDYSNNNNLEIKSSSLYNTMKELKTTSKQGNYLNYLAKTQDIEKDSEKNNVLINSKYSDNTKKIIYKNGTGEQDKFYNQVATDIDINDYLRYKIADSNEEFSSEKDENGKTISGSAKTKTYNWVNSNVSNVNDRLMILGYQYKLSNNERQQLVEHIKSTSDNEQETIDRLKMFTKNFEYKNGKIYYK